jgi:hypothetical protein
MIRMATKLGRKAAWAAVLVLGVGSATQADTVVYSNSSSSGDAVVGASSNVAIGASGWYYSDVRTGATIGIDSTLARSGNGSVLFQGDASIGNYKADISYASGTPLGLLKDLTTFSYDWRRDSSSTTADYRVPALRLLISDGTHTGYLVYEPVYNELAGNQAATTNQWESANITDATNLWSTGSLPTTTNYYDSPLSYWKSLEGYSVYGISSGIGSGWTDGTFKGAVDNITIGFTVGGVESKTTFNFEVKAVPEPASVVSLVIAGGMGLAGAAYRRRRAR